MVSAEAFGSLANRGEERCPGEQVRLVARAIQIRLASVSVLFNLDANEVAVALLL